MKRILIAAVLALAFAFVGLMATPSHASASTTPRRLIALRWAEAHAGAPYVWGGVGPWGFDCSGLVQASWKHAGVTLPRTTYGMLGSWHLVPIPASQRQRGDLAFYGSGHVELVTAHGTFGALQLGSPVSWHHPSGWWTPSAYYRVR